MSEGIIVLIVVMGCFYFAMQIIIPAIIDEESNFGEFIDNWFTPVRIHTHTNMNWLGCIVCSIGIFLLLLLWIIPYYIFLFFHWLFMVGRK